MFPIINEVKIKRYTYPDENEHWKIQVTCEIKGQIKLYQATFTRWHDVMFNMQRLDSAVKYNNDFVEVSSFEKN